MKRGNDLRRERQSTMFTVEFESDASVITTLDQENMFEDVERNYIPDFILNESFIEIKGYISEQWEAKMAQFNEPLKVLYKDDIKPYLDYVESKYGKGFISLYE